MMPAMTGWADPGNAVAYARFTHDFPMYDETSHDVVSRAQVGDSALVVDLCCGTGATSRALLGMLPASARVIAVDGSAAMLETGRVECTGADAGRIDWVLSPAEEFDRHITAPVDAVVCNSAIWQTDMPATFAAARAVLRPGGRLVFNIGEHVVELPRADQGPRPTPGLEELMVAQARADFGFNPQRRRWGSMTPETVHGQLSDAGFTVTGSEVLSYQATVEQRRAWLSVPVFAGRFGSLTPEQCLTVLDKAYAQVDKSVITATNWLVVTAEPA